MADTAIEWSDAVWNPLAGCTRVSAGCQACYAERLAHRVAAMGHVKYHGLTRKVGSEVRWTGEVRFVEEALDLPLRWKKPRRIFVNSMSDLFHEKVTDEWIDRIFRTMVVAQQHTYQILTKRPERMREYIVSHQPAVGAWPPSWIHLGVSVENQETADERIPLLLQTPAAVRFLSVEPLLGPVDLTPWLAHELTPDDKLMLAFAGGARTTEDLQRMARRIDWIIVGGESGPGARPCDIAWIRSVVAQAKAAGVPVFVKQLGRWVLGDHAGFRVNHWLMKDGRGYVPPVIGRFAHVRPEWAVGFSTWDVKGGDPTDWPSDLRVREFPRG
jgi:protein gp37